MTEFYVLHKQKAANAIFFKENRIRCQITGTPY
jgi:hypothetical protein